MRNTIFNIFKIFTLALLFFCLLGCMLVVSSANNVAQIINAIIEIVSILAAYEYFLRGAKKDAARYYKMFMFFEASTFILENLAYLFVEPVATSPLVNAFSLILFGNTLLLAAAKDLGKKVTLSLASFNLAVYAIAFVVSLLQFTIEEPITLIMTTTWFAVGGICLIMAIAKYQDKATRNSK